uniref:Uncharacterized protein n=1 Tax=Leptobrachium leishanense TaxID=445787 RepID=A0A8C5PI27_9ANUR
MAFSCFSRGKGRTLQDPHRPAKEEENIKKEDQKDTENCNSNTEEEVRCVSVLVVGAGSRGSCYTSYATCFPKLMKVVGVADPRACVREEHRKLHNIDEDKLFENWADAAEVEKFADAVIIATPDRLHKDPAVAFARKGYHMLLEKPMAVTPEDCREIVSVCKENGVILSVGHVMRYHRVSKKIKELIDSGAIGDVVHIQHMEPVGYWHFAHSFVRGNWRNEKESTFSLLAKSCHDIDLICYWLGKKRCLKVSSFGSLSHFTKENKPKDAGSRCLDCSVEETCPYSAKKLYLERAEKGMFGWPVAVVCSNGVYDIESLTDALKTGPYGRCIYDCDNDVVSNQGELCYNGGEIEVHDFTARMTYRIHAKHTAFIPPHLAAHGGADYYLIENFISAVAKGDPSLIQTGPDETLRSHLLVFEAERSRRESCVLHLDDEL